MTDVYKLEVSYEYPYGFIFQKRNRQKLVPFFFSKGHFDSQNIIKIFLCCKDMEYGTGTGVKSIVLYFAVLFSNFKIKKPQISHRYPISFSATLHFHAPKAWSVANRRLCFDVP